MSSKMPKDQDDATASVPRRKLPLFGFMAVLFGLYLIFGGLRSLNDNLYPIVTPRGRILVEKAQTLEERQIGLSGRGSLGPDRGMLFIFEKDQAGCFWMKDTVIPLDMIWLDSEKRVTNIKYNALPDSDPESYCPQNKATFVLELNAGQAERYGIVDGSQLRW